MSRFHLGGAALLAAALSAAPAGAQSLLSSAGLGYLLDPIDARSRGMGYVALGLPEPSLSLVNVADAAGLPAAGLTITLQTDVLQGKPAGGSDGLDFNTTRFPAIEAAFPAGPRAVVTVGYGAVLDQNWSAVREDSVMISGKNRFAQDRFLSRGAVSRFRAGLAYHVRPRLDVGVGVDVYTGAVNDSVSRVFPNEIGVLFPSATGTQYEWQGLGFTAGARYRAPAFTVSAAVTAAGDLTAAPKDSVGTERSYALPLTVDGGASAQISQATRLAASVRWSGWSAAGENFVTADQARDVMQAGGGIEYSGLRFLNRPLPVRLGARWAQLPFRYGTGEFADERALTAGLGVVIGGGQATLNLSGERGMRGGDAAGIDESFWRVAFSLSLLGR
ncbi:MAG TPA: hypothetical protein VF665_22585 [Longimicrobium sp.]|jgi:hypothetical protein|uniref:hypothetical protein n=1 Tax=Longimicrobium sp. TaxID=2029185 RepID=UPI002ED85279